MSETKYLPKELSKLDIAFGGRAMELLPPYKEIPDEFRNWTNQWSEWQAGWFYQGLRELPTPKEGIDLNLAMLNLKAIQGSFEPKHEHKAAGVAYLASLWFEKPTGTPLKQP